jgi:hypothetical protein
MATVIMRILCLTSNTIGWHGVTVIDDASLSWDVYLSARSGPQQADG